MADMDPRLFQKGPLYEVEYDAAGTDEIMLLLARLYTAHLRQSGLIEGLDVSADELRGHIHEIATRGMLKYEADIEKQKERWKLMRSHWKLKRKRKAERRVG